MKKTLLIIGLVLLFVASIVGTIILASNKVKKTVEVEATTEESSQFDLSQLDEYMKATTEVEKTTEATTEKPSKNGKTNTKKPTANSSQSSGSSSSTQASSTQSPSTQSPSTQSPSHPTPTTEAPTPSCSHSWKEIMKTVHHDAVYETQTIHHDAVYDTQEVCASCGLPFPNMSNPPCSCEAGRVPQDVLVTPAWDETKQVLVKPAWDEQVGTGQFKCTKCGKIK